MENSAWSVVVASCSVVIASLVVMREVRNMGSQRVLSDEQLSLQNSQRNESLMDEDEIEDFDKQLTLRWSAIKKMHTKNIIPGVRNNHGYEWICNRVDILAKKLNKTELNRNAIDSYGLDIWASEHGIDIKPTHGNTTSIATAVRTGIKEGSKEIRKVLSEQGIGEYDCDKLSRKLSNVFKACEEFVVNTTDRDPMNWITQNTLKDVNKKIMSDMKFDKIPLDTGEYRTESSSGGISSLYMEPGSIENGLEQLLIFIKREWVETKSVVERILLTAFFLERFLFIHPFKNGNGRTGRILFSILLQKDILVPVCLFQPEELTISQLRFKYIENLDKSRMIRPRTQYFCAFLLERTYIHLSKMANSRLT
jgi:Fic family protein